METGRKRWSDVGFVVTMLFNTVLTCLLNKQLLAFQLGEAGPYSTTQSFEYFISVIEHISVCAVILSSYHVYLHIAIVQCTCYTLISFMQLNKYDGQLLASYIYILFSRIILLQ